MGVGCEKSRKIGSLIEAISRIANRTASRARPRTSLTPTLPPLPRAPPRVVPLKSTIESDVKKGKPIGRVHGWGRQIERVRTKRV